MSILIIGANGNMGSRYRSILNHLGVSWVGTDFQHDHRAVRALCKSAKGIIIASPTATHCMYLSLLSDMNRPILCEKPFSKDLKKLRQAIDICKDFGTNVSMVKQYQMLAIGEDGPTYYDYFKHGQDGLYWDCIQIISLAKGSISLKEQSPIWKCAINGVKINISDMDQAYISFIKKWIDKPEGEDLESVYRLHEKTDALEKAAHVGSH